MAVERLVNLALYLAAAREPVTAADVRNQVYGYPDDQEEAAFLRMFERDKDELRRMGFSLESDEAGRYLLDTSATYASAIDLTAPEAAAIRVAGAALLEDPAFPFPHDLRLALAKISAASVRQTATALVADEDPERQGATVAELTEAVDACKSVSLAYTDANGGHTERTVEPYGLFVHDGHWYLVARDTAKDAIRTFAVSRMSDVTPNRSKPRTPDFERPADFDVTAYVALPFQIGDDGRLSVLLRFEASVAWRSAAVASGHGTLTTREDGSVDWQVDAASLQRLAVFTVENGPGLSVIEPPELSIQITRGLETVVAAHA